MLTQYSETDLEKHIEEYDVWADKFEKLPLYFMTFHGQQSIKAVLDVSKPIINNESIACAILENI
jgi:twinkle protein